MNDRWLSSYLYRAALAGGLLAIAAAAWAAGQHHGLALAVCGLIAAFFGLGVWELQGLRRSHAGLREALKPEASDTADAWLARVPAPLREAVQQRLQAESRRAQPPLPAAQLAPALSGLLVLLGMLGTFSGLLLTLGGTAQALHAGSDLAALRAALGAPVQGLGLAFSASVAGVAASAMLGLMHALVRRDRAALARQLDAALAGPLRRFTAVYAREQAQALREAEQAEAAEQAAQRAAQQAAQHAAQQAAQLTAQQTAQQSLMREIAQFAERLGAQLAQQQERFHAETRAEFQALAASVDASLRRSLGEAAQQAGAIQQGAAEAAMAGVAREASRLHQQVGSQLSQQLSGVSERVEAGVQALLAQAASALGAHSAASAEQLGQLAAQLQAAQQAQSEQAASQQAAALAALGQAGTQLQDAGTQAAQQLRAHSESLQAQLAQQQAAAGREQAAQDAERFARWQAELQQAAQQQAAQLQQWAERWQQGVQAMQAQAEAQSRAVIEAAATQSRTVMASADANSRALIEATDAQSRTLIERTDAQSRALVTEVATLLQAAGEAPRAAVQVVGALREQLAQSLAQDQARNVAQAAEREELLRTLVTLMAALQQAAGSQREAIDQLVQRSSEQLERLGERFAEQTTTSSEQLANAAVQVAAGSAELASLGEGFTAAVLGFEGANAQLVRQLGQLETQLAGVAARSDEQLGYYVAQARELIELCLAGQKQVLDGLKQHEAVAHG